MGVIPVPIPPLTRFRPPGILTAVRPARPVLFVAARPACGRDAVWATERDDTKAVTECACDCDPKEPTP